MNTLWSSYFIYISGVTAAKDFRTVQNDVSAMIKGRTLVGHALHNDLKVCLTQLFSFYFLYVIRIMQVFGVNFSIGFTYESSKLRFKGLCFISTLSKVGNPYVIYGWFLCHGWLCRRV